MKDENKTKEQLITELGEMRQRIAGLEASETVRKQVEEEIKSSAERLKILFEFAPDTYYLNDLGGIFVDGNRAAEEMIGYERGELIGKSFLKLNLLPPRQIPKAANLLVLNAFGKSTGPDEFTLNRKDGGQVIVEIRTYPANIQGEKLVLGIARDITERKRAEDALQKAHEELEIRVKEQTVELARTNEELQTEITEHKRTEEVLADETIRRRILVEQSRDGIVILDQNGKAFEANHQFSQMLGYSPEEILKLHVWDWDTQWTVEQLLKMIGSVGATGDHFETYHRRKDGTIYDVEISTNGAVIAGQKLVFCVCRDITERKQTERALRESEERFRIASQIASDVVYERDLQTGIATFYGDIDSHLGYEPSEYPCTMEGWRAHVYPEDLAWIDRQSIDQMEPGVPHCIEYRMRKKDGTYMTWLDRVMVIRDEKTGKPTKFIGAATDISERKRGEEKLRESEENFRHSLDDSPLGIRIVSANGEILYANQAILDIYGYASIKELKTTPTKKRYTPESSAEHQLRKEKRERSEYVPSRYEISIVRKDGEIRHLEVWRKQVLWNGKKQFQVVYQDITERKQLEAERQRVEKLESIGTLAAGIAHDFNNLLTGIMGNISLAKRHIEPEGKAIERLEEAEKASVRARDLTQQLLTFARGGAPIKKTISIGKLIRESASFALRGSKVRPEFSLPDDLWMVEADEGQINQVISNIVINADQAMPQGGVINIEAKNLVIKSRKVLPLPIGKYVGIVIKDQGVGISKEHLAKIFDPFFTTKQKGSRLGLTTAYSIINNHGGYITVESELGVGTALYVYLPASKKPVAVEKEDKSEGVTTGRGRILIMDDEETIRELLYAELTEVGYDVELTHDGAEAIERYKGAKEAGQPFDAVILDLTIPGGMGGKEAITKLLEIDPQVKAIVSSGYATDPIMSEYKKYGFSAVVTKPYSIFEIEKALHDLLNK